MKEENPLLNKRRLSTSYASIPFEEIKLEHFLPAVEKGIEDARRKVESIKNNSEAPTFKNIIEKLENCDKLLSQVTRVLDILSLVKSSDELIEIQGKAQELLDGYVLSVFTDRELFEKVNEIYQGKLSLNLDSEETRLLEDVYDSFIDNGVHLQGQKKESFEKISKRLSQLSIAFEKNNLAEDKEFFLHVADSSELEGLGEDLILSLKENAKAKGKEGYGFLMNRKAILRETLPFLKSRSLRKELYKAVITKCAKGGLTDNREIISEIVNLRLEKAKLLGYERFSDLALKKSMAKSTDRVMSFLDELKDKSFEKALSEVKQVEALAKETEGKSFILMPWDFSFYSERLKEKEYSFNEEELKKYFNYPKVKSGVFSLIGKLYGISFERIRTVQTWHPDVEVYKVLDKNHFFLGLVYLDVLQRPGTKMSNAWMAEIVEQENNSDFSEYPQIQLCLNLKNPDESGNLLMGLDDVKTFLHEFGHVLHALLSKVKYASLSGTNVSRDFVELPSQFMEDFFYEKDLFIKEFARHYKTGAPIPEELYDKILKAKKFNKAYSLLGQLGYATIDMAYNSMKRELKQDPIEFEHDVMEPLRIYPENKDFRGGISTSFAHIFSGGYASGYYSYQWSDVLVADAFDYVKHHEFSENIMSAFRRNILEKGGSMDPEKLYRRFRGKMPSVDARLKRDEII